MNGGESQASDDLGTKKSLETMHVRMRLSWILAGGLALGLGAPCCAEQGLAARHHSWGRFQPGAWKLVRIVTETLDEQGEILSTSTTETKTTLLKVEDDGASLEVEVAVEVAGKQFDGQTQRIKQSFHGEPVAAGLKSKPPTAAQVTVDDQKIDCWLQQIDSTGPQGQTTTKIYYSDSVAPYILKRESTTTAADGATILGETTLNIVALDMPHRIPTGMKNVACVKIVQKHAKGAITTLAMTSKDVPGGVVYHASRETDANGHILRRSTLELVSYGLQVEEERTGLFGRKRPPRRKPPLYTPTR